jgi:hypothetical protein
MNQDRSFHFQYRREIPECELRDLWNAQYPTIPFPRVRAYLLNTEQFVHIVETIRKTPGHIDTRFREYGRKVPISETWAYLAYNLSVLEATIFVRTDSPHPLEEDLLHELKHLYQLERQGFLK